MIRSKRVALAVGAACVLAGSLLLAPVSGVARGPQAGAAASSHAVKMTIYDGKLSGIKLSGKLKGRPFGNGTMTGKLAIPNAYYTWKFKNGTVKVTGHSTSGAADHTKGTWKITGGTGKYKGAKGKGTLDGYISKGVYQFKGTAKY